MAEEEEKKEEMTESEEEKKEAVEENTEVSETEILRQKVKELREAAENENYRKRMRQEKENAVKYANESLIHDLLDPLDNFSRAIEAAEKTKDYEAIKTGVVMVEDQLHTILKNNWGLESFSPEGEAFDPSDMEACMVREEEGLDKETVLQVFMKGYKLHGKVIRAAKVVVGKPKSN